MDQVQEEMAWQMAGMFVQEITSITSPGSEILVSDMSSSSEVNTVPTPLQDDDSVKDASIASSWTS